MEMAFLSLFGLWTIAEVVTFATFFVSLRRLLSLLQFEYPAKWARLTSHERFGWGPGVYVWAECRRFLRDQADDLGDAGVRMLKQQTWSRYRSFVLCSLLGPTGLVVFFAGMLVIGATG
jgi:hypothetical protein